MYNASIANIGLKSPTPSQSGGGEGRNNEHELYVEAHLINISSSLMTLGKHIDIPRQGMGWEFRNKLPLRGK